MTENTISTPSLRQTAQQGNGRDSTLDLIRIIAFVSVVSVHFFYQSDFYDLPIMGRRMYIGVVMRTFFMVCVPLFLILSGYLMHRKQLTGRYYLGVLSTVFTYLFASGFCLVFRFLRDGISVKEAVASVLNYSAAPYSWYIEMYLGLFLIIPFLNGGYHSLGSRRKKRVMAVSLVVMTALPPLVNIRMQILPQWWQQFYPVSYYVMGAYLSEYQPKLKNRYLLLILAGNTLLAGTFQFYKCYGGGFSWGPWTDWGSIFNVVNAAALFLLIRSVNTEGWNLKFKGTLRYVASLCLGGYLLSWVFDSIFYSILRSRVPEIADRFIYMPIMILAVASCSLLLSAAATFLSDRTVRWIRRWVDGRTAK